MLHPSSLASPLPSSFVSIFPSLYHLHSSTPSPKPELQETFPETHYAQPIAQPFFPDDVLLCRGRRGGRARLVVLFQGGGLLYVRESAAGRLFRRLRGVVLD